MRWYTCLANHNAEGLATILKSPYTLMGFADSGAHLRNMAFYNFPVRMLKWVQDASLKGQPVLSIEQAVHRLTGEIADWLGLKAGYLKEGGRADVVVLDPKKLDDMKLLWSFISKASIEYAPLVNLSGFQAGKGRQPFRLKSRKVHERSI